MRVLCNKTPFASLLIMMQKMFALVGLVLLCGLEAAAQYDPSFSHYWAMETSFNPAAAGKEKKNQPGGSIRYDDGRIRECA